MLSSKFFFLLFLFFCFHHGTTRYLGPAERVSLETAARTDRRSNAAMMAVSAPAGGSEGGEGERREGKRGVNPDEFEPLMYAQLALTSPPVDPDDCRCVVLEFLFFCI